MFVKGYFPRFLGFPGIVFLAVSNLTFVIINAKNRSRRMSKRERANTLAMYEGHIAKARRMGPARYGTSYARYTTRRYKSNPKGLLALVNRQIGRSEERKKKSLPSTL